MVRMGTLNLPELPPRCADGEHVLHEHDHSLVPPGRHPQDRCSGRFWCVRCKRWLDGAKCKPAPARAA